MPDTRSGSIEVLHLSKQFLQRETGLTLDVLNDISFCAEPGTFLALVGESGCGKTTLLRILAGLECADHGIVQINGKAVSGPNADCGMMFQQNAAVSLADRQRKYRVWSQNAEKKSTRSSKNQ